jgi:hypothetical protein
MEETIIQSEDNTRIQLSFNEEQEIRHRASEAYEQRLRQHEENVNEDKNLDATEATYGYYQDNVLVKNNLSYYKNCCIEDNWKGDINIERFWFHSNIYDIDKTRSLISYTDISEDDSPYYILNKSDYQEINVILTPEATEREYGRVFFSTETRYTLEHNPHQQPHQETIRGYSIYKNRKVYCTKYVNPYKGVLFHKNENGSIIRRYTHRGALLNRFYDHIESLRFAHTNIPIKYKDTRSVYDRYRRPLDLPTRPPYGPPRQGYIAERLYHHITRCGLQHDFETWALNHCTHFNHYIFNYQSEYQYPHIIVDDEQVRYVLKKQVLCRNWVKKIQRTYRSHLQKRTPRYLRYVRRRRNTSTQYT